MVLGLVSAGCIVPSVDYLDSSIGVNPVSVSDDSTAVPFINLFKQARKEWISFDPTVAGWDDGRPVATDASGWVTGLASNQGVRKLVWWDFPDDVMPGGDFVVTYAGSGTLQYRANVGPPLTPTQSAPGRDVITLPPGVRYFHIELLSTDPADYVRNIRVLLPGGVCRHNSTFYPFERALSQADCPNLQYTPFEDDVDQVVVFNPDYLSKLQFADTIRAMGLMRTNNSPVQTWEDRAKVTDATWSTEAGVPPEAVFHLANILLADAWINIPHQADDEYVTKLAELARNLLVHNQKVYVELSNEFWVDIFYQHGYAITQGVAEGLSTDGAIAGRRWQMWRSGQVFEQFEVAFGDRARMVNIIGVMAVWPGLAEQLLGAYPSVTDNVDAISIAPYFYDDETVFPHTLPIEEHLDMIESSQVARALFDMDSHVTVAQNYGVQLTAYEGGQSLDRFVDESNPDIIARYDALSRHPRMKDIYRQYLDHWATVTCNDGKPAAFMHFADVHPLKVGRRFGLLEHTYQSQSDPTPKYDAVRDYALGNNPCQIQAP